MDDNMNTMPAEEEKEETAPVDGATPAADAPAEDGDATPGM